MRQFAICSAVMLTAGCNQQPNAPVSEAEAREIAAAMFEDDARRSDWNRDAFEAVAVQAHPDGWSFSYRCKAAPDRRLAIFVERDGSADYDEAPVGCLLAGPER